MLEPRRTLRILIVDDHALFRESVARLLEAEPDFEVTGHCGTIDEAIGTVAAKHIDVVLLDFDLGLHDGTEFIPRARDAGFGGKVLVVTAGVERRDVAALIKQGISGIFMKHDSAHRLAEGIRDVAAGKTWFEQTLLEQAVACPPAAGMERRAIFTARERSVLALVFEGMANKEIADRIAVSESSVKATLQQLFVKTGVRTRSQLVRIVLEEYKDQL